MCSSIVADAGPVDTCQHVHHMFQNDILSHLQGGYA